MALFNIRKVKVEIYLSNEKQANRREQLEKFIKEYSSFDSAYALFMNERMEFKLLCLNKGTLLSIDVNKVQGLLKALTELSNNKESLLDLDSNNKIKNIIAEYHRRNRRMILSTVASAFGIKSLLSPLNFLKKDAEHFKNDFSEIRELYQRTGPIDQWNEFVEKNHITTDDVKLIYKKRRLFSCILLFSLLFIIFLITRFDHQLFIGVFLIVVVIYIRNSLRLYQLRERNLCKVSEYLKKCIFSWKEIFPINLPETWVVKEEELK